MTDHTHTPAEVSMLAVKVRPLVWKESDRNGGFYADFPIKNLFSGYYQITQEEFGLATVEFGIICHEFGGDIIWKGPSAEAKAAAQADDDARIMAAIEPAPDPRDQVIAQLVGALETVACGNVINPHPARNWHDKYTFARIYAREAIAAAKAVMK